MGQGTTGATVPTTTVMPQSPLAPPQGGLGQGTFAQQHDMMHKQMGMPQQMPAPMPGSGMSGMQSWDMKPALDMQANNYSSTATTDQLKPAGGAK